MPQYFPGSLSCQFVNVTPSYNIVLVGSGVSLYCISLYGLSNSSVTIRKSRRQPMYTSWCRNQSDVSVVSLETLTYVLDQLKSKLYDHRSVSVSKTVSQLDL
jgi:hypothetical protein